MVLARRDQEEQR